MRAQEQAPDFAAGKSFGQEIAQRKIVAERFAHLFSFHQQVRAVQPVFDKWLSSGAFALGDFILMMAEKSEILAAQMQIDIPARGFLPCSWQLHRLDMPSGTALAKRAWP